MNLEKYAQRVRAYIGNFANQAYTNLFPQQEYAFQITGGRIIPTGNLEETLNLGLMFRKGGQDNKKKSKAQKKGGWKQRTNGKANKAPHKKRKPKK